MPIKCRFIDKNLFTQEFVDKFWSRVDKNGPQGCWDWIGHLNKDGYGKISFKENKNTKKVLMSCHRISYTLEKGAILDDSLVMHLCNRPSCVRPDHLALGTPKDNIAYAVSLNRMATGKRSGRVTHPESWPTSDKHWTKISKEGREKYIIGESNPNSKLTAKQVLEIRDLCAAKTMTQKEIGKIYGVTKETVIKIKNRSIWSSLN